MKNVFLALSLIVLMSADMAHAQDNLAVQAGLLKREFILDNPPFKASHASTIVETKYGLLAAWFGGSRERSPDVGIWIASNTGDGWSAPAEVANGIYADEGRRYPCWNPVLFLPKNGPLLLFYKVGPSPSEWWGMLMTSWDNGKSWSAPTRLPRDIIGPVRNKPVELPDGVLLCGASTEDAGWRIHMETTRSYGKFWTRTSELNSALEFGAIQPTILVHAGGQIQILCRTKQHFVVESWSKDGGKSWSPLKKTSLPNPNSGIDAVKLRDGRSLLVYNHSTDQRSMLNVAVSENGTDWQAALVLENEPGEFSYPAVIQTSDGLVHATYTWKRERIRHVVMDPAKFNLRSITGAEWPR
ncbi:MAG: exo-alpha-sialidase [Verrucomicrobia bacterium]|nr:exo-alpha-sialidase [Verrucomicrobiota bacterium]